MGSSIQAAMDGYHRLQETRGNSTSSNITEGTGLSRSQTDSLSELDQWAERYAKNHHLNEDFVKSNIGTIAKSAHASLEAEGGFKVPLVGGGVKVKAGTGIKRVKTSQDTSSKTQGEGKTISVDAQEAKDLRKAYDNVQRAFKDKNFNTSDTSGKNNDQGITASMNKARRAEESMNRNLNDAKMWQQGYSYGTQSGLNMDENMNNEFMDWMRGQNHPTKDWSLEGRSDYDLQKLLDNPEHRKKLSQGFLRHKAEQYQAEFKASGLPDKSGVQKDHEAGVNSMPGGGAVNAFNDSNVKKINEGVVNANLHQPVSSDNQVEAQETMNNLGSIQNEKQKAIQDKLDALANTKSELQEQFNNANTDKEKTALGTAMQALGKQEEQLRRLPPFAGVNHFGGNQTPQSNSNSQKSKVINTSDIQIDGSK